MTDKPTLELMTLEQKEVILLKWLDNILITNQDEQRYCEDMLIAARRAFKEAEAKRKELLIPANQETDRINNLFKPYLSKLTRGIEGVNNALKDYHTLEAARVDAERIEAMKAQAEAVQLSKETGEIIELPQTIIQEVQKTSRADIGTVTYKKVPKVQIVQPDLVPREYCEPVMAKLNAAVRLGATSIPGCLISMEIETVARGSRQTY